MTKIHKTSKNLSPMDKKMNKLVKRMDTRDKNPMDNSSNRTILRELGYSDYTTTKEIINSKSFVAAETRYYKKHPKYDELQDDLAAKARRNLDEGMDAEDEKIKFKYTDMQFKQEAEIASRSKLELKDMDGNMMTLMGITNADPSQIMGGFKPIEYDGE